MAYIGWKLQNCQLLAEIMIRHSFANFSSYRAMTSQYMLDVWSGFIDLQSMTVLCMFILYAYLYHAYVEAFTKKFTHSWIGYWFNDKQKHGSAWIRKSMFILYAYLYHANVKTFTKKFKDSWIGNRISFISNIHTIYWIYHCSHNDKGKHTSILFSLCWSERWPGLMSQCSYDHASCFSQLCRYA